MLDPPYSGKEYVYSEANNVSVEVNAWCVANGDNPLFRIALCGYDGERNNLESAGWAVLAFKGGGYQGGGKRERVWFSPHCLAVDTANEFKLTENELA